jgi:hypothetical protein
VRGSVASRAAQRRVFDTATLTTLAAPLLQRRRGRGRGGCRAAGGRG